MKELRPTSAVFHCVNGFILEFAVPTSLETFFVTLAWLGAIEFKRVASRPQRGVLILTLVRPLYGMT